MQDRMPLTGALYRMPLTEAANVCERVHLHPTPSHSLVHSYWGTKRKFWLRFGVN